MQECRKESRSRRGGARNARAFVSLQRAKLKGAEVGCEGPQMHLPQSLPLHRINGFARFFHGFISVLLLHSGHSSKPQFFHCFSIVSRVLYAIMVPHRSLNFSIVFPSHQFPSFYFYYLASFSKRSTQIFHWFPIVLCDIPSFFPLFFSSFSPPLQSPQVQIGGRTRGESIPHRHPIATWYITLKKFTSVRLFYHLGLSKNPDINQMVFPRVIVFFPLIVFPSAGFTPS